MKRFWAIVLRSILIVSIVALFPFILRSSKMEEKGIVTYVDGRVSKKNPQLINWVRVPQNSDVIAGDRVRTYQRSRAEIELMGLDIIRLAPETIIDIIKLYEESKEKVQETILKVEKGDLWANLSKKQKGIKFRLDTPIAGAAITGTKFRLSVATDSTTEFRVYTGAVVVSNVPEKTGLKPMEIGKPYQIEGPHEVPGPQEVTLEEWAYIVREMQKIKIGRKGQVLATGDFSLQDSDEQTNWVKWNMERDKLLKRDEKN
ncbi:hypothetical protein DRQ00_01485 [candidate division KSB1 bacterium]|nr:MAG: hypothetical protein B5M50_03475 [candidate division KSB1 bacterium 4484_219]RKY80825.1 MAG: hypothetical protein DRQ00_01485 [candidate division KSB1 bacterium]